MAGGMIDLMIVKKIGKGVSGSQGREKEEEQK